MKPATVEDTSILDRPHEIITLRDQVLGICLKIFSVLITFVLILSANGLIQFKMGVVFAIGLVATLWILAIAWIGSVTFLVKAISLLSVVYILGIAGMCIAGLSGEGQLLFLAFVVLSTLLFGWRGGLTATLISGLPILVINLGFNLGWFIPLPLFNFAGGGTFMAWARGGILLLLLGGTCAAGMVTILNGLENSLSNQKRRTWQLEAGSKGLEERVREHTASLERRLVQIRTAAEISKSISSSLDSQELLSRVVNLVRDRFNLYYAGVFLIDEQGQYALLRAGTGEAGEIMLANQHRLAVGGSSMIGWAIEMKKARIALDVGQEAVHFNNPNLPLTRSEMALPLIAFEKVLGAMTVQSTEPSAFDDDDIIALQGIADVLSSALQNARLFKETQENFEEIRALHRQYLSEAWAETSRLAGDLSYTVETDQPSGTQMTGIIQVPLSLRDQVIGQITLETDEKELSAEDMAFIESVTTQTAIALENARLLEETQRRAAQEETLNEMSTHFSRAIHVEDILRIAVQELGNLPTVSEVSVYLEPQENEERLPGNAEGNPKDS